MTSRSISPPRLFSVLGVVLAASLMLAGLLAANASALSTTASPGTKYGGSGPEFTISTGSWSPRVCSGSESTGQQTNSTEGEIKFEFFGCQASIGGACTTAGQSSGRIVTEALNYKLVYLNAEKTIFGLMIIPKNASVYNYPPPFDANNGKIIPGSGSFASYSCVGNSFSVRGSVMSQITSPGLNVPSNTANLALAASGNSQTYRQIEGAGLSYQLTEQRNGAGSWISVGLNLSHSLTAASQFTILP